MPSLETMLNPALSAQWREYFALLDALRPYAVWQHPEDGELRPSGLQRPPRFVAAVESPERFAHFQQQAAALSDLRTKWPVQAFDEVWGWGRVSVGSGSHSRRLEPGLPMDCGQVKDQEQAARVITALEAQGHGAMVADGQLMVTPGAQGLTVRQGGGRAFRLAAWGETGEVLHSKLSVGAVVCRGVHQGIHESSGPRKTRADTMHQVTSWEGLSFWQKRPLD